MYTCNDNKLTKEDMLTQGYPVLIAKEIVDIFSNATITAKYYYANKWFLAKTNSYEDGRIEGENHVGSYNEGRWSVDEKENTLSLEWDGYGEDWTAYGYKVKDEYMFFNTDTGTWRITLSLIESGILPTNI